MPFKYLLSNYRFLSYSDSYQRIDSIGRGFLSLNLWRGQKILLFAETRPQWLLTVSTKFWHRLTVVTLYSRLGEDAILHGMNKSQVSVIVTSFDLLSKLNVIIIVLLSCFSQLFFFSFFLILTILHRTEKFRQIFYFPLAIEKKTENFLSSNSNVQFISLSQFEDKGKSTQIGSNFFDTNDRIIHSCFIHH